MALVSVLLPTFNSARYLAEAIESTQAQTVDDFELRILDGGSDDETVGIAKAYAARDQRISIEIFSGRHPTERIDEIMPSLKTKFVAMQHSDDVSYKNRFEKQIACLTMNAEVGICSGLARAFWHDKQTASRFVGEVIHKRPESHAAIKSNLLFWWTMHCPTLLFRRDIAHDIGFKFANEFNFTNDYWQTVTNLNNWQYHNIQEELSAYRMHFESDGPRNLDNIRHEELLLKQKILAHFGIAFSPRELEIHQAIRLIPDRIILDGVFQAEVRAWLQSLRAQNQEKHIFDEQHFNALIESLLRFLSPLEKTKKILRKVQKELRRITAA